MFDVVFMLKIKKIVLLQNVSIALGVLAFCLSIFSAYSISKINEKIKDFSNDRSMNGVFKPIKDIPDVEIVNKDGSVVKVHAKESSDELGKIIDLKREKNNSATRNANTANNKQNSKTGKDDKKNVNNSAHKNNKQQVVPVSRHNAVDKAKQVPQQAPQQQKQQVKKVNNNNIVGDFIVQIGAFKDKSVAEKQCQKARPNIEGRRCGVVPVNEQTFRAVVYPFATNESAVLFANKLTNVLGTVCIAKKNV